MKLSLGFSTCPNDTFIFDAMVHQKVDTEGLEFDVVISSGKKSSFFLTEPYNILTQMKFVKQKPHYFRKHVCTDFN